MKMQQTVIQMMSSSKQKMGNTIEMACQTKDSYLLDLFNENSQREDQESNMPKKRPKDPTAAMKRLMELKANRE